MTLKRVILNLFLISPAALFWLADYKHAHTPAEDWLGLYVELLLMNISVLFLVICVVAAVIAVVRKRTSLDFWLAGLINLTVLYPYGFIPIWW